MGAMVSKAAVQRRQALVTTWIIAVVKLREVPAAASRNGLSVFPLLAHKSLCAITVFITVPLTLCHVWSSILATTDKTTWHTLRLVRGLRDWFLLLTPQASVGLSAWFSRHEP